MQFIVSIDDLDSFAEKFWQLVGNATVFAFHGEMGAGKTTIIGHLCKARGVEDLTGSPTFSIINEYRFKEGGVYRKLFHIDLYRLKDQEEVISSGVEDCVYSGEIVMVEWPEKAPYLFDEQAVHVLINAEDDARRSVEVRLPQQIMQEQS